MIDCYATVTVISSEIPLYVTVIFAVPDATAVTTPSVSTVAVAGESLTNVQAVLSNLIGE